MDDLVFEYSSAKYSDGWNEFYNETVSGKVVTYQRDTYVVPIVSWIIVGVQTILVPILTVLIILRRKHQPLVSRNWVVVLVTLYSQLLLIYATILRLAVGRWRFPCLFYTFAFCLLPPLIYLHSLVKMMRLFFVFRLSQFKTRIAGFKRNSQVRNSIGVFKGFVTTSEHRSFRIQKFLASLKCMFLVYVLFLSLHIILWFALCFSKFNARDLFRMNYSCGADFVTTLVVGLTIFFYIVLQGIFLVVLFIFKVKDRWGIRLESTVTFAFWFVCMMVTFLLNLLYEKIYVQGERYMAVGFYAMISCFVDLTLSVIVPVVRTFFNNNGGYIRMNASVMDNSSDEKNHSDYDVKFAQIMSSEECRNLFKDFCTESLSVEPICFIEDVMSFKNLNDKSPTSKEEYESATQQIVRKFLMPDSPLLLNLPNTRKILEDVQSKIARSLEENGSLDFQVFLHVENLCLDDLKSDTFSRFIKTKEYAKFLKEQKKIEMQKVEMGVD